MNAAVGFVSTDTVDVARRTLKLATPLILSQFVLLLVNAVPLYLMGHFTEREIAAVALAQAVYMPFVVFGTGVMQAVGIIISKQIGAGSDLTRDNTILSAIAAIGIIAPVAMIIIQMLPSALLSFGQPKDVVVNTQLYLTIVSFSLPANYLFWTFRSFASARSVTSILVPLGLVAVAVEITIGYVLTRDCGVCGNLGIKGGALALFFAQWTLALGLTGYILVTRRGIGLQRLEFDTATVGAILRVGVPIGLAVLLESGFMAVLGVISGSFGAQSLAFHGVALQIISVAFAIPLGLGQATTLLISRATGKADVQEARIVAMTSVTIGLCLAGLISLLVVGFSDRLFTYYLGENFRDSPLRFIIYVVAVVHLLDTLQGIGMSMLRGLAATRAALTCAALGYWAVGVVSSLLLGRLLGLGLYGVWAGFGFGLAFVALLTISRFFQKTTMFCSHSKKKEEVLEN